jgi:hypothetical protein
VHGPKDCLLDSIIMSYCQRLEIMAHYLTVLLTNGALSNAIFMLRCSGEAQPKLHQEMRGTRSLASYSVPFAMLTPSDRVGRY